MKAKTVFLHEPEEDTRKAEMKYHDNVPTSEKYILPTWKEKREKQEEQKRLHGTKKKEDKVVKLNILYGSLRGQ